VAEDLVGRRIGKYELSERIGRGGMAEVYKAYHAALDRYVALKVLHPFLGEDPEFKDRFEREARNVAQLRQPNIVQVYDFEHDESRDLYYMVMEYIDGPTLRTYLMQKRFREEEIDIDEALRITRSVAHALDYAHQRGMIHRDIKPANIMIDYDGRVVLTDFGIARIVSGPHMTASGSMVGTPTYMSPEQGLGQAGDHRSDIYSLGVVLFQLVTGTVPYNADTPIAVVLKHVNDPLPPPNSLNPSIPEGVERIIYRALAKSPDERFQDVQEMLSALNDLSAAARLSIPQHGELPAATAETAISSSTVVGQDAPRPWTKSSRASQTQVEGRRRGCLTWLLVLILAAGALAAGVYLSYTGLLLQYLPFVPDPAQVPAHESTLSMLAGPLAGVAAHIF